MHGAIKNWLANQRDEYIWRKRAANIQFKSSFGRLHTFKHAIFLPNNLKVRFGTHKRYQDWFQRQYLATSESQSLRCDLIRFIVGVIHPTNELLGSDIIPRWAVIGWLLTTCTNQVKIKTSRNFFFMKTPSGSGIQ